MIDLDDASALRGGDPGDMLVSVASLPSHCREGHRAGHDAANLPRSEGLAGMAFCGMGGSGVSGDVLRALARPRLSLPVDVVKGPELPAHCGPGTLVVLCSYSGNTAETLACAEAAIVRGCRTIAITSGGELARRAADAGAGLVTVPGGLQPRAALGYLALGTLGALEASGVLPGVSADLEEASEVLGDLAAHLAPEVPVEQNAAKAMAGALGDRLPVIWGAEGIGAVAAGRWKTQFNENAKIPAFASALPELDHNEVVGWADRWGERFAVVTLRHEAEHPDVAARFALSAEIAVEAGAHHEEAWAAGESDLARLLTLVLLGDFASTYHALAHGIDPTPVAAIDRLKAALAGT